MIDEDLINGIRKNEETAFTKLYGLYAEKIYKTAYMMTNDMGAAQDIVQEVFIRVFTRIKELKNNYAFNSWLYRITVNCCLTNMKETSKYKLLSDDEKIDDIIEEKVYLIPEENLLESELCSELIKEIYELPKLQRVAIILYFFNEMSIKEISGIMECSEGTVKSRLFHGKKNLKLLLEHKNRKSLSEVSGFGYGKVN